jgi:hypothetical protein
VQRVIRRQRTPRGAIVLIGCRDLSAAHPGHVDDIRVVGFARRFVKPEYLGHNVEPLRHHTNSSAARILQSRLNSVHALSINFIRKILAERTIREGQMILMM